MLIYEKYVHSKTDLYLISCRENRVFSLNVANRRIDGRTAADSTTYLLKMFKHIEITVYMHNVFVILYKILKY